MISTEQLSSAVQAGILSADQAERLARHLAGGASAATRQDIDPPAEERVRFLGGFNDIFVTIGIALVFFAYFSFGTFEPAPALTLVGASAIAWALSEVFVRRMRTTLPGRVLGGAFVVPVAMASLVFLGVAEKHLERPSAFGSVALFLSGASGIAAAWVYFRRFQVPFVIAVGSIGAMMIALAIVVLAAPKLVDDHFIIIAGAFGVAVFAFAMWFDFQDPERLTWRNDAAFWLHILAAPLIVHPAVFKLAGGPTMLAGGSPVVILALFVFFTLVALVVDRRALIVSALVYAGGALTYYTSGAGGGVALTLLILGLAVLGLSAGWRTFRRAVLPLLPLGGLRAKLPPP
jgi:hypothetical protein